MKQNKLILGIVLMFLLVTTTFGALTDNNVLYYSADNSSLNITTGGSPIGVAGKIDGALDFDGSTDVLDIGTGLFSGLTEFTTSLWFNQDDVGDNGLIAEYGTGSVFPIQLVTYDPAGHSGIDLRFTTVTSGGTVHVDYTNPISTGAWHHIVTKYDGSRVLLYLDGNLIGNESQTGALQTSTETTYVGNVERSSDYMNGKIDEVAIWDVALSSSEITALYNSGSGTSDVPQTNLVYHDTMDEVYDLSNNTNHGEYNGGVSINTDGKLDSAFDLDGTDCIQDTYDITAGQDFSFSTWIKSSDTTANTAIFGEEDSGSDRILAYWQNGGAIQLYILNGASDTTVGTTNTWDDGAWHHLVMTFNGTSKEYKLYMDNNNEETDTLSVTLPAMDVGLNVGCYRDSTQNGITGSFDEVSMYSKVLTTSEISELYNSGDGYNPYAVSTPVYTNMTFTANNVYDNSAINSFNITINGTTYTTTNGTVTTAITDSSSDSWNYNFTASGYYPQSGTVNASNSTLEDVDSYQAIANIIGLGNFNNGTISGVTFNASAQSGTTLYLNSGSINVDSYKAGWYNNSNTLSVTALTNQTYYFTGLYDTKYNVTVEDWYNNVNLSSFQWTISNSNNSWSYTSTGGNELINIESGTYTVLFHTTNYDNRSYTETVTNMTDSFNGKIYLTTIPRFLLNAYEWTGTTLLPLVTFTSNITGAYNDNPYNVTMSYINESNPSWTTNINIVDNQLYHQNYNNNFTFSRNNVTQNVTLSPNQLSLTFSGLSYGYVADTERTYGFNNTQLVVVQQNLTVGRINVRFDSELGVDNLTLSNHTQYYEYDNTLTTHITENIQLLSDKDWSAYLRVTDQAKVAIEDVLIRAEFAPAELDTWSTFALFGQRLTNSDGYTYFVADKDTQVIFTISKDGYTPKSITVSIGDEAYTYEEPLTVILEKSPNTVVNSTWLVSKPKIDTADIEYFLSVYASGYDDIEYTTSYRTDNGLSRLDMSESVYGVFYSTLVDLVDYDASSSDNLTITIYDNGVEVRNIVIDKEATEEVDIADLDDKGIAVPIIAIMVLVLTIIAGTVFKSERVGSGAFIILTIIATLISSSFGILIWVWIFYIIAKLFIKVRMND